MSGPGDVRRDDGGGDGGGAPFFAVTVVADRGRGANLLPRGREAGCETGGADGIGARGWRAGHGCGSWGGLVWVGKTAGPVCAGAGAGCVEDRRAAVQYVFYRVSRFPGWVLDGWWRWMDGGQTGWDGGFFGGVGHLDWEVIELTELR